MRGVSGRAVASAILQEESTTSLHINTTISAAGAAEIGVLTEGTRRHRRRREQTIRRHKVAAGAPQLA